MFQHLLLATDGSDLAQKAVAQGLQLAKALAAKVTIVTATKPWLGAAYGTMPTPSLINVYEKTSAENAEAILTAGREAAKKAGVACAILHVKDEFPPEAILATAKEQGCDVIVMGSHGRGAVGRLLLGSEVTKVLASSTVPVLVCR